MPFLNEHIVCKGCGKAFDDDDDLDKQCWEYVINIQHLDEFKKELSLLDRLEIVYQKYPESKNVRLPFEILLESDDPEIQSRIMAGEAFASIPIPEGSRPDQGTVLQWTNGDQDVANFILSSSFNFEGRREWVKNQVIEYRSAVIRSVKIECCCPNCGISLLGFSEELNNE